MEMAHPWQEVEKTPKCILCCRTQLQSHKLYLKKRLHFFQYWLHKIVANLESVCTNLEEMNDDSTYYGYFMSYVFLNFYPYFYLL